VRATSSVGERCGRASIRRLDNAIALPVDWALQAENVLVKHWQETAQILDRVVHLGRSGRSSALAIVTRIDGSAYRRPGAKLLIQDDGSALGGVSGGCLEEDVRQVGLQALRDGHARLRHYSTGDDENKVWGLGLGCDGHVDVLVQAVPPAHAVGPWADVRSLLEGDAPFALSTILEDGGERGVLAVGESGRLAGSLDPDADPAIEAASMSALGTRRAGCRSVGAHTVFTEVLRPPPTLLVCGAGDDARPLAVLATAAGFRVSVVDHRTAYLTRERFPGARTLLAARPEDEAAGLPCGPDTYAVVMTHSLHRDTDWVRRLIGTDVPYVGVLGPRARTARILDGLGAARQERLFGPVGLDLGADGPEQVALSIVSEVLAVCTGREPGHLRERAVAVHARR
jgi:xanthine dehydrogenase accessory factor